MRRFCALDARTLELLGSAVTRGALSARAFDRVARVARTIADLAVRIASRASTSPKRCVYRGGERTRRAERLTATA